MNDTKPREPIDPVSDYFCLPVITDTRRAKTMTREINSLRDHFVNSCNIRAKKVTEVVEEEK